uniref:Uncharacterized protein n=1 Tax=Caenorhabditis tropicalis TaxID=1561998 RepID=A0A1I7U3F4_9PELO
MGVNKGKLTPKPKTTDPPIELTVCSSVADKSFLNETITSSAEAESNHQIDTSVDTSSTDTGTTSRMENGGTSSSKVPVLAAGTYHRKEAAPILAAAARLDLSATPAATTSSAQPPVSTLTKEKNKGIGSLFIHKPKIPS